MIYNHRNRKQWLWLKGQYLQLGHDEWIIMPNHMHGVVVIKKIHNKTNIVGTGRDLSLQHIIRQYIRDNPIHWDDDKNNPSNIL